MKELLMKESDWSCFEPFFSKSENWGDPEKISFNHLTTLWMIRKHLNWPMIVHCSFDENGHANHSFHSRDGFSRATDFHFQCDHSIEMQLMMLEKALSELGIDKEVGLGVYPTWKQKGFHLDSRGYQVRWLFDGERYHYGTSREIVALLLEKRRRRRK